MRLFGTLALLLCVVMGTAVELETILELTIEPKSYESDSNAFDKGSSGTDGVHTQSSDQGECRDEPPSVLKGKPLEFERTSGSIVEYECNGHFYKTRHSTVRCESGSWKGQPPTCVYFDPTFVLDSTPIASPDFNCYSDENFGKIEYSRVLDTRGGDVGQDSFSRETFLNRPRFNDTRYGYTDRIGAFHCELNGVHGYMKIVTLTQSNKFTAEFQPSNQFKVANAGDAVELEVKNKFDLDIPIRWKLNGVDLPTWNGNLRVKIENVKLTDAGIYECFYEGRRSKNNHAFIRLIVRQCKENYYGENCEQKCPPCYNGGICHDHLGICVCPAGFTGNNCEIPCNGHHFGANCSNRCASPLCAARRFCKPDPFGCACAAGFTGSDCCKPCGVGWYGADCKQRCHCAQGDPFCDKYTGFCEGGCAEGWTGRSCQIHVPECLPPTSFKTSCPESQ